MITINGPDEYLGAIELLARLRKALGLGKSYMHGDDWNLFSAGIIRRIEDVNQAIQQYRINLDTRELISGMELTINSIAIDAGVLRNMLAVGASGNTCDDISIIWGSPAHGGISFCEQLHDDETTLTSTRYAIRA